MGGDCTFPGIGRQPALPPSFQTTTVHTVPSSEVSLTRAPAAIAASGLPSLNGE